MKKPPSIDTLRYAQRLEDNGMNHEAANAMAQALNEELADRLLTKADVREEIRQELAPIHAKLDEFGQRFAAIDGKFGVMDAKFGAMDAKFEAKFEAMDVKIGAMDAKFEAKFDSLSKKLSFVISTMMLVVALLVAMGAVGLFQIVRSLPPAPSASPAVVERPAEQLSEH